MTILATSSEKVVEIKYFAHNKSSREKKRLSEFNGSMIISKISEGEGRR